LLYGFTWDWYAAEDLAQNAFAAAERRWTRVGCLDKPGAWVRKVAVNGYRRWRRRGELEARVLVLQPEIVIFMVARPSVVGSGKCGRVLGVGVAIATSATGGWHRRRAG
jgi:DNA-directed RNA polymerase specialized sigma24 family protein